MFRVEPFTDPKSAWAGGFDDLRWSQGTKVLPWSSAMINTAIRVLLAKRLDDGPPRFG
jgi:hypothetical protein